MMGLWDFLAHKQNTKQEFDAVYRCNHNQTQLVYIITSNGVVQYKRQCVYCFQCVTGAISHKSLSEKEKQSAVLRDDRRMQESWEKRQEDWIKARQESFWKYYTEYLSSSEWSWRHNAVLKRDHYTCQLGLRGCERKAIQVHHLTYENVGNEPLEDLMAVCVHCHEIITEQNRR